MKTTAKLVAVGALTAMTAACAAHQATDEGAAPGETGREVTIEVQNQNFYDARIYLIELGTRTRLGNVSGNSTRVFRFSAEQTEIQILVDFIGGGGGFTTDIMVVNPGEELLLIVTANAHQLRTRG